MVTKKDIAVAIFTFCLTSTLFMIVPTRSQTETPEYDPWTDLNDDGIIDIFDIVQVALAFGAEGTPINKTALLLELLDRLNSLEAAVMQQQTAITNLNSTVVYLNETLIYLNSTRTLAEYVEIEPPQWSNMAGLNGWSDWDLSSYIPSGALYAEIEMYNHFTNLQPIGVREDGSSLNRWIVATQEDSISMTVKLGSSRIVERFQVSGWGDYAYYTVVGYWTAP